MMPLVFGALAIPGLVIDPIQYSPWEQQQQFTKVAGLIGETALNMLPGKRVVSCEMFLWNSYVTEAALYTALGQLDSFAGVEATLGIYDPTGTLRFTLNRCMLQPIQLHFSRYDDMHGWWARIRVPFAQLRQGT